MAKTRKVIQIAMGGEGNDQLYALCDDGTIWKRLKHAGGYEWIQITADVPQPT
jgi:hypothetical protein